MPDLVAGHPSRRHVAGRVALVLGLLGLIAGPAAPLVGAAGGLTVTTPFPAVVIDPGSTASFKLTVDVAQAARVDLASTGVPDGWTVRFRGGGMTVDGAYVDPKSPPDLTVDVQVPDTAAAGSSTIVIKATSGSASDTLPLTIRVTDASAGDVTLTSDFPELRGPSTTNFTFNVTIHNGTATESTFTMDAVGQAGWTVTAKPSGEAQATSTTVKPGGSAAITVSATAPATVAAGSYPIQVTVSGPKSASIDLNAVVTGTYTMSVSTPDQVLSTTANAGSQKDFQITIANTGTAPITNVKPTATPPTGWKVTFDQETIASIDPNTSQTVTAQITPSGDAIAGDYEVTMTATAAEASDSTTIRVRVETPQFWWIVGIVLIGATFVGLYWVFRKYGRR